jgi:hypothetical protein
MNGKVRAHSGLHKVLPDIVANQIDLIFPGQFYRQRDLQFPCQLGTAALFDFLYAVPKGRSV